MGKVEKEADIGLRCIWGILLLVLCLFLALSLFSYSWEDIGKLKIPPNDPPCNLIGPVGAWLSFLLFMTFGVGAYLIPLWCAVLGLILIFNREERIGVRAGWCAILMLAVVSALELHESWCAAECRKLNIADAGGVFSRLLIEGLLVRWVSPVGTGIIVWSLLAVALVMFAGIGNILWGYHWIATGCRLLTGRVRQFLAGRQDVRQRIDREERRIEKRRRRLERTIRVKEQMASSRAKPAGGGDLAPEQPAEPVVEKKTIMSAEPLKKTVRAIKKITEKKPEPPSAVEQDREPEPGKPLEYELPPASLLEEVPLSSGGRAGPDTGTTARVLIETLAEFGIEAEVANTVEGPVVTRYELLPAPGVRVERISGLSNNLALSLKATSVRVQAPVPGKGVVGIEVPNSSAETVYFREIIEGETWESGRAKLPLVLGKDVGGKDLIADLTEMPHLLIAGATGSGKTVCMNSILAGLLFSRSPTELRLMLVDPKIVEFSVYNQLPHLVVPVITDPKKVALGLRWAINEMEKRYKLFAKVGVRNIESYNHREIAKQEDLFGDSAGTQSAEEEPPKRIPYIVIVIDELADLMLAAQAEIENSVARLAQLSRAVGIHMILSTQRPSVNVITGTIKANFPARIAFQVAQKVDSRTILDTIGADKLLGSGDMLFHPPGISKLARAQGAMTSDIEIRAIVDFVKKQGEPDYEMEIKSKIEQQEGPVETKEEEEDSELLAQALDIIRETHRASTSSLQRRLRIGYTRAARIMDIFEEKGIVGPPRGSDPREILIDLDAQISENDTEEGTD